VQSLYQKKGEGAMFRSKLPWTEHGEKPTRFFFNMEGKKLLLSWKLTRGSKYHTTSNYYIKLKILSEFTPIRICWFIYSMQLPELKDDDKENLEGE